MNGSESPCSQYEGSDALVVGMVKKRPRGGEASAGLGEWTGMGMELR